MSSTLVWKGNELVRGAFSICSKGRCLSEHSIHCDKAIRLDGGPRGSSEELTSKLEQIVLSFVHHSHSNSHYNSHSNTANNTANENDSRSSSSSLKVASNNVLSRQPTDRMVLELAN